MKIFALILLLMSGACRADVCNLNINLHAHHFARESVSKYDLNEINPGVGLEFRDGQYRKMFGIYKNSERNTSAYALLAWTPIKIGPVEIGAFGGAVTGYAKPYMPAAGIFSAVQLTDHINMNITIVPTIQEYNVIGFMAFQLSYRISK